MSSNNHKKWFIILNPKAFGGLAERKWNSIQQDFEQHQIDFVFEKTTHPKHAIQLAGEAIGKGFRKIMAAGGDGTANEVANGILQQNWVKSDEITFALLPMGTGNDWIKTHQIPKKMDQWLAMILNGKTSVQDAGRVICNWEGQKVERYFINVAGMAYDAFAVRLSAHKKQWTFPKIQYLWLVVAGLFKYKLNRARLIFNGKEVVDFFYTINIGVCKYSGGGMQLVPHAVPDDGQLALTYAGKLSKINVILNTFRFYNGSILKHPKVNGFLAKKIKVETVDDQPTGIEVDGEFIGETPVEIEILPKALKIILP